MQYENVPFKTFNSYLYTDFGTFFNFMFNYDELLVETYHCGDVFILIWL